MMHRASQKDHTMQRGLRSGWLLCPLGFLMGLVLATVSVGAFAVGTLKVEDKIVSYWPSTQAATMVEFQFDIKGYRNTYSLDCEQSQFRWTSNVLLSTGQETSNASGAEWKPLNPNTATSNAVYQAICPKLLGKLKVSAPSADTGSYWDHNGSLMRLRASGNDRIIEYLIPSPTMKEAGVEKGTLLFRGVRQGDRYVGTARVFSKHCTNPIEYHVDGRVVSEQSIILTGRREVYDEGCIPSGSFKEDTLEFRYTSSSASAVAGQAPDIPSETSRVHTNSADQPATALPPVVPTPPTVPSVPEESISNVEPANPEHVAAVKAASADAQSVKDFTGFELSGADLSGLNLAGANFTRAKLDQTKLNGTNLAKANLTEASMRGADFSGAQLSAAVLDLSIADNAKFTNSALDYSQWKGASAIRANFQSAAMTGIAFSEAKLDQANFTGNSLTRVQFKNVSAPQATFDKARLSEQTSFSNSDFTRASFASAKITGAQFNATVMDATVMDEANFSGAIFTNVHVTNTRLRKARFAGATMIKTELGHVDARQADFSRITMKEGSLDGQFDEASFREVRFSGVRYIGGGNADSPTTYFNGADFSHADLSGIHFRGVEMRRAKFLGTQAKGSRFGPAILDGIITQGADFSGTTFQTYNTDTTMTNANFQKTTCVKCNFNNVVLQNTRFDESDLSGTSFSGASARLGGVSFRNADLTDADFSNDMRSLLEVGVIFDGAVMRNTKCSSSFCQKH